MFVILLNTSLDTDIVECLKKGHSEEGQLILCSCFYLVDF